MKAIILSLFSLIVIHTISQEVAKSNVGYKPMKWKQLDALALKDGRLLSWEQHGNASFIRVYKESLKLDFSFKIAEGKKFLKLSNTSLIEFNNGHYIVYDGKVENKQHQLFAQKINLETKTLEGNKKVIGTFETNSLVKGYFEIQGKDSRRLLISYHQRITKDYHQKVYVNLLNEKLESVNEKVYQFEHKGRMFRKIKYLMLPNNDVVFYGELYKDNRLASNDELHNIEGAKYKVFKLSLFEGKDTEQEIKVDNLFISDIMLKLSNDKLLVGGFYSDYSDLHNKGFFKTVLSLDLGIEEQTKMIEFSNEFSNKVNNAMYKERENHIESVKGASFLLETKLKSKVKNHGGLYSFKLIDIEQGKSTTNFIAGLNYKYSVKEASFDNSNSTLFTDQRNNYIEGDVLYVKTDFEKITNFQQLPRFNVIKSKKDFLESSVQLYHNNGNDYIAYTQIGKYVLYEKVKDDYTYSELAKLDYEFLYKKRGEKFVFNPQSKAMYSYKNAVRSYKKEDKNAKRIQLIRIN